MTRTRVRACIVGYRSGDRAIRAARSALEAGAEVVFVDNSPEEGAAARLRAELPGTLAVEAPRNLGFAAACNLAAKGAETDHLLFLNPDATLAPGCLDALAARLDAHPEEGVAGPAISFPDGRPQLSVRADPNAAVVLHQYTAFRWLLLFRGAWKRYRRPLPAGEDPVAVPVLMGSVLLVRRRLFEDLGGFDERYFMYYEEADLCRRARETGAGVVFVPAARAVHEGGASARAAPLSLGATRMVSAQRYVRRFAGPAAASAFRAAFLVGFPLRALFDLNRDLLYTLGYAVWPPKHAKVGTKAREAMAAVRLLTVDLFRVAAS